MILGVKTPRVLMTAAGRELDRSGLVSSKAGYIVLSARATRRRHLATLLRRTSAFRYFYVVEDT